MIWTGPAPRIPDAPAQTGCDEAVTADDDSLCEGSCGEPVDGTYCEHHRFLCGACLYLCAECMDEMNAERAYDDDRDEGL